MSTEMVLMNYYAPGLSYFTTPLHLRNRPLYLLDQGLVDNVEGGPLHVLVPNFGQRIIHSKAPAHRIRNGATGHSSKSINGLSMTTRS